MTITRLAVIAIAFALFIDMKFSNARLFDALWGEVTRLGYWLNSEISGLTRIARLH
jgi:hypothetical protein